METGSELRADADYDRSFKGWFFRPCGMWDVLRLSTPIVISSASLALMNFADRVYLTWYDQNGMAAAFQAGCLMWALTTFPGAVAAYADAFVSQYYGAGERNRIGLMVWQSVFFGLATGLLFIVATPLVERLFFALNGSEEMTRLERNYWFFFALGASPGIAHEGFTAYFAGQRDMKTVMISGIAAVVMNVVLDPIFIFGINGHLRFGVEGAAIASAISLWFKFLLYLCLAFRRDRKEPAGLRDSIRFDASEMKRLLRFGSMSGVQATAENLCFTLFILLMGTFGAAAGAAAAIAINLDCLAFMPMFGLGIATTTLVGNEIGAGRPDMASRATRSALLFGMAFTGIFTLAFFFAPNFFLDFYALKNPEEFEKIRSLTVASLRFVSLYMFFDSINVVCASALRGAGDARFIMRGTIFISGLTLLGLFAGVFGLGHAVKWSWSFISIYVIMSAAVFGARLAQGGWRTKSLTSASAA